MEERSMADQSSAFEQWFVKSSYQEFVKQEGLPMYEGSALENLAGLSLADWERRGKAAYTRLGNQEDYSLQIVETPLPGLRAAVHARPAEKPSEGACKALHGRSRRHHGIVQETALRSDWNRWIKAGRGRYAVKSA
jgi:hypothetical protein